VGFVAGLVVAGDRMSEQTLAEAALEYVLVFGYSVFPLEPKDKVPLGLLVPHGCLDASNDPRKVKRWWKQYPDANIGIATGLPNTFDAQDFDNMAAMDTMKQWADEHGFNLQDLPRVQTGSGFRHVYWQSTEIGNKAGVIEGMDWRGVGGYVVAPPSIHPDTDKPYQWIKQPNGLFTPVPPWLLEIVRKAKSKPEKVAAAQAATTVTVSTIQEKSAPDWYINAAVDSEIETLRKAKEGTRNDTLNRASYALGTMVGAGWITRVQAESLLKLAAYATRLEEPEVSRTIRSGLDDGILEPRSPVEGNETGVIRGSRAPGHAASSPERPNGAVGGEANDPGAVPTDDAPRRRRVWTLNDLPQGDPPPPLVDDTYLSPEGMTVIYGPGGVGKGLMVTYLVLRIIRTHGIRVSILDFESHPFEWGRRAKAMGYTEREMGMVEYYTPHGGDYWPFPKTGPIDKVAGLLREGFDERDVRYVAVDSFSAATSGAEAMGGQVDAVNFFEGMRMLNRPGLAIAHVASGGLKWPSKPYGSIHIHNQARETWAVERFGDDTTETFVESDGTSAVRLEIHNKKMNGRESGRPQFLNFRFMTDGTITTQDAEPMGRTLTDQIVGVLSRSLNPLPVNKIVAILKLDEGKPFQPDSVLRAMKRFPGRFERHDTSPMTWSLKEG
jgi:hypothetical protein